MATATRSKTTVLPNALGLNSAEAAKLLGISRSHFRKLYSSDRTPRPRRLGRRVLWSRAELVAWFEAGCPSYDEWQAMREGGQK